MDIYKLLGARIKFLRTQHGLSQARLADIINSSAEFISRVECGRAAPSIATAHRIAQGLGVDLKALFDFSNESGPDKVRARANRIANMVIKADEGVGEILEDLVVRVASRLRSQEG